MISPETVKGASFLYQGRLNCAAVTLLVRSLPLMSPIYTIESFDFHTYWNNNAPAEREKAWQLREQVQKEFASEIASGDLRVFKFWDKPVGPHPITMFEVDTAGKFNTDLYARLLAFYMVNHNGLSVLIHPRTDKGALMDHTEHALWLGHKVRLDTSRLKAE